MNRHSALVRLAGIALAAIVLTGCATAYRSHGGGVYQEADYRHAGRVTIIDPLVYPYWSLDYFYFSRYYHPYSVVVHRYDPWYYPYPGWYYGYRPGRHAHVHTGLSYYYPWYRYGGYYGQYRPWQAGSYFSFGYYHDRRTPRVRQLDSRLQELETHRSQLIRSQRPDRTRLVPGVSQRLPASRRPAVRERGGPAASGIESIRDRHSSRREQLLDRLRSRPQPQTRPPRERTPPPTILQRDNRTELRALPRIENSGRPRPEPAPRTLPPAIGPERSAQPQRSPELAPPPSPPRDRAAAPARRIEPSPPRSSQRTSPPSRGSSAPARTPPRSSGERAPPPTGNRERERR